jgi:hypothetical protein
VRRQKRLAQRSLHRRANRLMRPLINRTLATPLPANAIERRPVLPLPLDEQTFNVFRTVGIISFD